VFLVSDIDTLDQALLDLIQRDLKEGPDATYNRDALGATVYLHFLLKNKISSTELDRLVDWVNDWVDNILNKQLFSRYVDRELASALFGFYTLKIHSKLKTRVEHRSIKELMDRFGEDNAFFGNLTYTIMILLAVADFRNGISLFEPTLKWVEQQMENGRIFNDGKNLVFASLLFEKTDSERAQKMVKISFQKFENQSIPFNDQMYYAWILWDHKTQFDRKGIAKIRDFADSTLRNAKPILKLDNQRKTELETEYGSDDGPKVSRILVGVYLDLLRSFNSETIRVDKSELETTSLLTRLGGFLAVGIFGSDFAIGYLAYTHNLLERIPFNKGSAASVPVFILDLIILSVIVILLTAGGSIFYDTVLKGIGNKSLIRANLSARISEHIKLIIISGIIAGIITALIA
jgi:hypothetical protein